MSRVRGVIFLSKQDGKIGFYKTIVRGVISSVLVALSAILIFALILRWASISNTAIKTINQFIKVIAIFAGCFFSLKGEKGLIKGAVCGGFFSIIMFLLFSIIGGKTAFSGWFFLEVLFGAIVGGISGILTVNARK